MKEIKINDAFNTWTTSGIFSALYTNIGDDLPFYENESITKEALDLEYHANHSGHKTVSPLIDTLLEMPETYTGHLTSSDISKICDVIWSLFHRKWDKLYETLYYEYNPIENYNRTEEHTGTDTVTDTPDDWEKLETQKPLDWTNTSTQTPSGWKETTTGLAADNESDQTNKIYGFNSSNGVDSGKTTIISKDKHEVSRTGTYETENVQSGIYETSVAQTGTYAKETEYDSEIHIHGNIGVTTSQQMIQSERDLWIWDYMQQVMNDIDSVVAIKIY